MDPIIYRSTDASAPALSGTVGSLVALLDACLVTGYGSKSPAGWTKPFTGTNRAAFRAGAGPQHYLDVYDNGAGTGGAREAECRGYETMTAVGVGTQVYPPLTSVSLFRKSTTADGTARTWMLIADDRTFYFFPDAADLGGLQRWSYMFGEFFSVKASGDAGRSGIIYRAVENSTNITAESGHAVSQSVQTGQQFQAARNWSGLGPPQSMAKIGNTGYHSLGTSLTIGIGLMPFPNPPDSGFYACPVYLAEVTGGVSSAIRGRMRGFYAQIHPVAAFIQGDEFDGCGDYDGKRFIILCKNGAGGWVTMETTEWEVSE